MEALKLHMDCDGYYAACQISEDPDLLGKPMVVGGDQEARHGIVLAKSQEAKRLGIKTGNPLWKAREVCPNLVVVPADFDLYKRMTDEHRAIAGRYGPVQPYGPDEQWIDLGRTSYEEGQRVADEIRSSVYRELGITASIEIGRAHV